MTPSDALKKTWPEAVQPLALSLRDLRVVLNNGRTLVDGIDLDLPRGRILGLAGESGSGKTTTARALLGFAQGNVRILSGALQLNNLTVDLTNMAEARAIRGKAIAYVPQHAASAMNPSMRVEALIREMIVAHGGERPSDRDVETVLDAVGLPFDHDFRRRFPHQLSGGQVQRVALAIVLIKKPSVIVLDEPTTGLDVLTQRQVLAQLKRLRDEQKISLIVVSHDLAVLNELADEIAVMLSGRIIEQGLARSILNSPQHDYTKKLIMSAPGAAGPASRRPSTEDIAIEARGLIIDRISAGVRRRVVDDVSLEVKKGLCLALVGTSGSGKTTVARAMIGLQPKTGGSISFAGEILAGDVRRRTTDQRRRIQLVPQDSLDALNPRHTIAASLARPLQLYHGLSGSALAEKIKGLLAQVSLSPDIAARLPATLSGGERQRASIARALAAAPEVMICDEITSALDVSVQASILALLGELKQRTGVSILFITHDLGVVADIADDVLVLKDGKVVEHGPASSLLRNPVQPYTRALIQAAPRIR